MSYWGFWAPITPAITGPWFSPEWKEQSPTSRSTKVACSSWLTANALTDPEPEVVEGVLVDDVQLPHKGEGELHHRADVHVLSVMFLRNM